MKFIIDRGAASEWLLPALRLFFRDKGDEMFNRIMVQLLDTSHSEIEIDEKDLTSEFLIFCLGLVKSGRIYSVEFINEKQSERCGTHITFKK